MKIHKEGYQVLKSQIVLYLIISASLLIIKALFPEGTGLFLNVFYYGTPIFLIIFLFCLYFFRIPKRTFERKDRVIYAPCDGKVIVIEETIENEYYKDKRIQISVFMSPLNIHNNLYPISGEVMYTKYHPGKFLVAWHPKASADNEKNTVVVENKRISVLFRQIAGAVAKRIVTYSKVGNSVDTADECGFIKFGSRMDIFLPIGTKVCSELDQKVKGGQSVLATY